MTASETNEKITPPSARIPNNLCGNQISGAPRHRRDVVPVTATLIHWLIPRSKAPRVVDAVVDFQLLRGAGQYLVGRLGPRRERRELRGVGLGREAPLREQLRYSRAPRASVWLLLLLRRLEGQCLDTADGLLCITR